MATFSEANRVRAGLKLRLSEFSWFKSTNIVHTKGDHIIVVHTTRLDMGVRKTVPQVVDGVEIRTEVG